MAKRIPKEFISYTQSYPMLKYLNRQKEQQKEWNNPATRQMLDKLMPGATDSQKYEAVRKISDPKADAASVADFLEKRQKYRS